MGWPDIIDLVNADEGIYRVRGKVWEVGRRYILHEHIGAGSYGDVCRVSDSDSGETVAMKRIGDVLMNPMLAKRVLREVCIMRRIAHPYIIRLTDVFTRPSREVEGGVDLYIATEFADGGDMYRMKEQLSANDVKLLLWQLLVGVRHLHSFKVWHRDIKSENTLVTGHKQVKVCDFGLARSALGNVPGEHREFSVSSKQPSHGNKAPRRVLTRSYTKTVVTPSYRAPEVVMSRGRYDSAIDIWSLGCIFWELLMRQMSPHRSGPPAHPLFGVRGEPVTPNIGQEYVNDCSSSLPEQLDVIFDVIGTPCWSDIEAVGSEEWRAYLKRLPGRAGNLAHMMSECDPQAVDLLHRMLAFNPARRCSAEEALAHNYFDGLRKPADVQLSGGAEDVAVTLPSNVPFWKVQDPAVALGLLESELELSTTESDGGKRKLEWLLEREADGQKLQYHLRRTFLQRFSHVTSPYPNIALPTALQMGNGSRHGSTSFTLSSETPTWPTDKAAFNLALGTVGVPDPSTAPLRSNVAATTLTARTHHHHQQQQLAVNVASARGKSNRPGTSSQYALCRSVGDEATTQTEDDGALFLGSGRADTCPGSLDTAPGQQQQRSQAMNGLTLGLALSRPASARTKMMKIRQGSMLITTEVSTGMAAEEEATARLLLKEERGGEHGRGRRRRRTGGGKGEGK